MMYTVMCVHVIQLPCRDVVIASLFNTMQRKWITFTTASMIQTDISHKNVWAWIIIEDAVLTLQKIQKNAYLRYPLPSKFPPLRLIHFSSCTLLRCRYVCMYVCPIFLLKRTMQ